MSMAADAHTWPLGSGSMASRLRALNWSETELGPIETWPAGLRCAVQAALDSALPTFIWWGASWCQIHNDAASALIAPHGGAPPGDPARRVMPGPWKTLAPALQCVTATGSPATKRDIHLFDTTATLALSPIRDDDGTVCGVQGIAFPATSQSHADGLMAELEERRRFALELSDALWNITDPIEVQAVAARLVGERLQTDRAYYLNINEAEETLVIERQFVRGNAPSMVGRHRLQHFPWLGPAFRPGEPVVIHNSWTTPLIPDEMRPAMDMIKVGSFIAIPLVKEGQLVAALCVADVEPREWTPGEVSLLQATAERTWAAVEQARAEEQLKASEEQYRTLFNSIDEGFCIIEMIFDDAGQPIDYRFLEVNPAFEQHSTMKNAVGRTMREFIPDHESDWFEIYGHVAMTGEQVRFINEAAGLGDRWFELNAFRVGDPELRRVAVLFTDITDRTRAEANLRASEARFRGFAEASADTLWIVDAATGALEYLSPAYEHTWGEPRDASLQDVNHWYELVHDDDRLMMEQSLAAAIAGETYIAEYRIIRANDGAVRWIRETGFPIFADDGHVSRAAGIAQDITEQKIAEQEREAFVDAAAHDLKTPLTSLRGQAQLLLRRARREKKVNLENLEPRLVEIDAAALRMVTVINEMLDAAHLRAERALDLRLAPVDLIEVAEQAITEASRSTMRHVITLETDGEPIVGVWDELRLGRVLGNLLANAVKFSPDGGDILLRLDREEDAAGRPHAVVSVSDRGIGIPAADLPQLFQRFWRAGNATRIPGTGIGLSGARQIVQQHGGTLTVTSEEGHGSVFVVRLPLFPPDEDANAGDL
jgi:PAS domain S-box-containing protein